MLEPSLFVQFHTYPPLIQQMPTDIKPLLKESEAFLEGGDLELEAGL